MADRRVVNPKVLLLVAGVVLVVCSAIAIFMAVSYTPQTSSPTRAPSPATATTATTAGLAQFADGKRQRRTVAVAHGVRRGPHRPPGERRLAGSQVAGEPRVAAAGDHHPQARARAEAVRHGVEFEADRPVGRRTEPPEPVADIA